MIDYNKLKQAHELAEKHYKDTGDSVVLEINMYYGCANDGHCLYVGGDGVTKFNTIDSLITELQELIQPESKYRDNQRVWFIDCTSPDGPICDGVIERQELRERLFGEKKWVVTIGDLNIPEDCVYPSRQALIQAQINYWGNLLKDEAIECEHDEDEVTENEKDFEFGRKFEEFRERVINECNHMAYGTKQTDNLDKGHYKCCKCGEFFTIKCNHESDGDMYTDDRFGCRMRCKKCGDYFK